MSRTLQYLSRNRPRIRARPIAPSAPLRCLVSAPTSRTGPLLERREDRELPPPPSPYGPWPKTLPFFIIAMILSSLGIFNYQKSSSSVVNSTMYALRTNPRAKELLGEEIYFRDRYPWIWGSMNSLHGKIDIGFGVKGTKARGYMRFRSERKRRKDYFKTVEWSLETEDGQIVQLLDERNDPLAMTDLPSEAGAVSA